MKPIIKVVLGVMLAMGSFAGASDRDRGNHLQRYRGA